MDQDQDHIEHLKKASEVAVTARRDLAEAMSKPYTEIKAKGPPDRRTEELW